METSWQLKLLNTKFERMQYLQPLVMLKLHAITAQVLEFFLHSEYWGFKMSRGALPTSFIKYSLPQHTQRTTLSSNYQRARIKLANQRALCYKILAIYLPESNKGWRDI